MEMPPSELIDRITILELKAKHLKNEKIREELEMCKQALTEFKNKGIKIENEWINRLRKINSKIWNLEAAMVASKDNLEKVGQIALEIRTWNNKRALLKNKIKVKTGTGFEEFKIYYASKTD